MPPMQKAFSERARFYQNRFGSGMHFPDLPPPHAELRLSVVIPAFDEQPEKTLQSLGGCPIGEGAAEVLLVLNHPENAEAFLKKKHREQYRDFHNTTLANGVPVYLIPAFDLAAKQAGVGLARKIGMDIGLQRFAEIKHDGLLVCLDADCTVSPNYLEALHQAGKKKVNGLSLYFEHPLQGMDAETRERIGAYETWLRYYVHALRWAGYPHSFHTVGSSMAVRALAYAKIGGMNRRKAGEDFYFLHKLIPQGNFYDLSEATVFPSARTSERVPFGTGRAMREMEEGTKDFGQLYHPLIFKHLRDFLHLRENIFEQSTGWPAPIRQAFEKMGWEKELKDLAARSSSPAQALRNFDHWFDGFRALKLVHFLRDEYFATLPAAEAVAQLFPEAANADSESLLEFFRHLDREAAPLM